MGLHTSYLGRVRISPPLNDGEAEFVRAFNRTRHSAVGGGVLSVSLHPADDPVDDDGCVPADSMPAPGMPGLWCPWTCCPTGCCLVWDGAEKPSSPDGWLRYVIDVLLTDGSPVRDDPRTAVWDLRFDHVLDGVLVGERAETGELFALRVRGNQVRRSVLVAGHEGADEWGYREPEVERRDRRRRQDARRLRYERADRGGPRGGAGARPRGRSGAGWRA